MKPSKMIELAIANKQYPNITPFMCCAVILVSKDHRRVIRTQNLILKAIAPFATLSAYLKEKKGIWPTDEQNLAFWAEFVKSLKKQNL